MFRKFIVCVVDLFLKFIYKVNVIGEENLEVDGGYVLTANHRSNWDVVVLYVLLKRQLNFMAKAELFENAFAGWFLKKFGAFPVKRNSNDINAIKQAIHILNDNKILAIFPQGKRSSDLNVDDAKAGAVLLASRCQKPIVPIAITGEYKFRSKINIIIGDPMYFEGRKLSQDELNQNTVNVMKRIKELSELL